MLPASPSPPWPPWGTGEWHLRNDGDQVLLLGCANAVVDAVAYGDAVYPGVVPDPGVGLYTHSLERYPPQFDTDDWSLDFRDWPFPNPGELPQGHHDAGREHTREAIANYRPSSLAPEPPP